MKKTILIVGIACAAVMALGQSNARQDNSAQSSGVVSPRDVATGQASGKRMYKPLTITKSMDKSSPELTVRESPSKAPLGKASVDQQANAKTSMSGAQSNPMYKDKGKSGENPLFEGKDRAIVKSKSNITNNRVDTSSNAPAEMKGDFSRGHQPDRKAPATAGSNTSREAQSGLATGKRQHN